MGFDLKLQLTAQYLHLIFVEFELIFLFSILGGKSDNFVTGTPDLDQLCSGNPRRYPAWFS
jgi:hypothetical protein